VLEHEAVSATGPMSGAGGAGPDRDRVVPTDLS
jgi:hypothetical protein